MTKTAKQYTPMIRHASGAVQVLHEGTFSKSAAEKLLTAHAQTWRYHPNGARKVGRTAPKDYASAAYPGPKGAAQGTSYYTLKERYGLIEATIYLMEA